MSNWLRCNWHKLFRIQHIKLYLLNVCRFHLYWWLRIIEEFFLWRNTKSNRLRHFFVNFELRPICTNLRAKWQLTQWGLCQNQRLWYKGICLDERKPKLMTPFAYKLPIRALWLGLLSLLLVGCQIDSEPKSELEKFVNVVFYALVRSTIPSPTTSALMAQRDWITS